MLLPYSAQMFSWRVMAAADFLNSITVSQFSRRPAGGLLQDHCQDFCLTQRGAQANDRNAWIWKPPQFRVAEVDTARV